MTLQLTSQVIERFGWEALTASAGEEALAILKERGEEVDLVLLDLAMPRMNGYAVAAEIRGDAALQRIPIVALTARAEYEAQVKARQSGIDDIVYKPSEVKKLHRALDKYLT
jgi:CheY-like chemotaxis protein